MFYKLINNDNEEGLALYSKEENEYADLVLTQDKGASEIKIRGNKLVQKGYYVDNQFTKTDETVVPFEVILDRSDTLLLLDSLMAYVRYGSIGIENGLLSATTKSGSYVYSDPENNKHFIMMAVSTENAMDMVKAYCGSSYEPNEKFMCESETFCPLYGTFMNLDITNTQIPNEGEDND